MFHVTADNRFPYWLYGGQQESGSAGVVSRSDYGEITFREWHAVGVEEYGYAAPDPLHPGIIYGGKVTRYDERTGDVQNVGPVIVRDGTPRFVRTAPILFSPADPHVLFFALEVLFKTTNGGHTWTVIGPDLTRKAPGVPSSLGIYAGEAAKTEHRGVIYSIGPSPRDVNVIWVGSDDGLVHVTRDGGKSWTDVTPKELTPWSKVTQIDASHFDPTTAYVSVSRFRIDDLTPLVFATHDGGRSWTTITRGMAPNASVNVIREDPEVKGLLYAGTEREVYVSFNDGAIVDYYLGADAAGPVTLEIFTASGKLVRRYSSADKPEPVNEDEFNHPSYWVRPPRTLSATKGMHRFVWDLRYPSPGAVHHEYPISAIPADTPREPLGVLAVPGAYSVKLTVNGTTE